MGPVARSINKSDPDKLRRLIDTLNNAVNGGGFLGFKLDPGANPLPNESIPSYAGRRIRESLAGAAQQVNKDVLPRVKQFTSSLMGEQPVVTTAPSPTEVPKPALPPGIQPAATYTEGKGRISPATIIATRPEGTATLRRFTGEGSNPPTTEEERIAGIVGRISPENPYGANIVGQGKGAGVRSGQIWVGATTDAEAARNLQDRAAQDEAAKSAAASFDRQTQALKSLREARSPGFRFGVDSIGGGPDKLDVASGRVINRDTPIGSVADRMTNIAQTARGKAGRIAAEQIGKAYLADKALQQSEIEATKGTAMSPLDLNKYLLDQQKFAQQQAVDRAKLGLDAATLQNSMAGTRLNEQKYADLRKKNFLANFSYPEEGAPTDQIGAAVLAMSDTTGGAIPPEAMVGYFQKAVKEANIDWKNNPPKDFNALTRRAMELATIANKG